MTWREKFDHGATPVSFAAIFKGDRPAAEIGDELGIDDVIECILRPGFPALTGLELSLFADRLRAYIDEVGRTDVRRIANVRHEPDVVGRLIGALARSVATKASYTTLAADIRTVAPSVNAETIASYVGLLKRLFVVEEQPPWAPALRSRARMRSASRLHLVDPALAAAALGAGADQLRHDLNTLGTLFESAVIHDLMVLTAPIDGQIRHYRDSNDREIDAIITLPDGCWGAVEAKLGGAQITAGAESLRRAIDQIDTDVAGEPAFRMVVTGTGPTLTTDDGTVITSLAP